jgi:D-lactate dehydrogenase (cytochrome)
MADASIAGMFRAVLPADRVSEDTATRRLAASDIAYEAASLPACVLTPRSEAEVTSIVRSARTEGVALHPRGGGWSYTAGYAPQSLRSAIVGMSGLGGIEIDTAGGTVEAGAGVTWSALDDALKAQGLRVPSFGPLSGIGAQIGATVAQDGGFFGGAGNGAVGENSVASVRLIDGRGERHRLTQQDRHDAVLAPQPLAGDCGAFGIKTAVSLHTMARPAATLFASFAFRDSNAMTRAMASLAGLPGLGEVFAFDEGVHQNLAQTGFTVLEAAGIAGDLLGATGSWTDRLGGLIRTARAGKAHLAEIPWSLHISVDGTQAAAEEMRTEAARRIAALDGEAIPDVIPRVTRAKPFRPIKALVTSLGERWLPSHGLVEAGAAAPLLAALRSVLAASADERKPVRMRSGFLVALFGRRITIEPQLYWPDALSAYTLAMAQPEQVKRFAAAPANEQGRALAYQLRTKLIAAMDAAGAGHFQIGRTYANPGVPREASARWPALKRRFDPDRIINPGALGL